MKPNPVLLGAGCAAFLCVAFAARAEVETVSSEAAARQDAITVPPNSPAASVHLPFVRAKASRHGPFRTSPDVPLPRHAYSPFDRVNQPPERTPVPGRDFVPGRIAIKLKSAAASQNKSLVGLPNLGAFQKKFAAYGLTGVERAFRNAKAQPAKSAFATVVTDRAGAEKPDLTRWLRANCPTNANLQELFTRLAADPDVELVEPDYVRRCAECGPCPLADGSDPRYAQQWHLAAAHIPEAWAWLSGQGLCPGGCRDIVVAVIDTGVDYTHPDLAANIWTNPGETGTDAQGRDKRTNGVDDDGDGFVDDVHGCAVVSDARSHSGDPADDHGHGTHVAGILAAQANNGQGVVGVAYNVQVIAIKAAQYSGALTTTDIAEGINYAVDHGADIINMSFGGYTRSQVEEDALAVAFAQCVLVAAAGNDGVCNDPPCNCPPMFPAAYNWVLGVMASTPSGGRAGFSNWDCIPHNSWEYELMAPGVDIVSALPNNQYAAWDGTSMAAPIVSGIAALARTKWSDKDVYSSRFIMGQIAANGGSGANAIAALTTAPRPELSYLEHWTFDTPEQAVNNDSDGIVDSGETVDLAIVIRNHWGQASNVVGTLEAWAEGAFQADPYVTWLTNTVNFGAVGSFNIDDNGLIYSNQVITGVRHPFRFFVTNNCPNDHIIPFKLTLTCENGLNPADTTTYSNVSRFFLIVQRGRELPRIISQDMTLTKDDYWLIPDATLIEAGVTVRVTEGTQVQFGSGFPNDPYHGSPHAYLQVEGNFIVNGSVTDPVDLFQWSLFPDWNTWVYQNRSGTVWLEYARVRNPLIGASSQMGESLMGVDHCYFYPDAFAYYAQVNSSIITRSIFHKCGGPGVGSNRRENLYDSCVVSVDGSIEFQDNVLLKNYLLQRTQWGDRQYLVGNAADCGASIDPNTYLRPVFPTNVTSSTGDKTYFLVPADSLFDVAELFARDFGGHLASVNDAAENEFLKVYRQEYVTQGNFNQLYPSLTNVPSTGRSLWEQFPYDLMLGLNDRSVEGTFVWSSGETVTYTNWSAGEPNSANGNEDYVLMDSWSGQWRDFRRESTSAPGVCEVPGLWEQAQLDAHRDAFLLAGTFNSFRRNAILNTWWDPDITHWLKFKVGGPRYQWHYLTGNYWGTTASTLIDAAIIDYNDNFNVGRYLYAPPLSDAPETCYPFVENVTLSTAAGTNVTIVGAELVTFTVTFNRDMNPLIQPMVSFGPDVPYTDFTAHPVGGGWRDARTWVGTFTMTPITGDGYQFIRVANAVAANDPWLVTGDDSERIRFEIITSGTESMNLQASGGEGRVDLSWMQDDFDMLAGYQLYRSLNPSNSFNRINTAIVPAAVRTFTDTNVQPGTAYYYRFSVVKTDMSESTNYSNVAQGTPLDTIPPVLTHTPVTSAPPGMPLTVVADATDNVGVQSVTLHFRTTGTSDYAHRTMTRTSGNRYGTTLEGSRLVSPGIEYYVEATDGISTVRSGRPEYPWQVTVADRPVVTVVTPSHGPASGGTLVTLTGSNFKTNATVSLGGTPATAVTVLSSSQIACTTASHFPATVDVTVVNPDQQAGTLLRGYIYESDVASLSLPQTGGAQHALVQVPINAANVQGLFSASVTVSFDASVLRGRGAGTGSLTPGWSVVANTNTPGQMRVSMGNSSVSSGSGVLAFLEFEVLGAPGSTSALSLVTVSLNDGALRTESAAGSFAVSLAYNVGGSVRYWSGGTGVSNVSLALEGNRVFTGQSGSNGVYTVTGASAGSYTLTPSKSDEARGISAYDASLVLQHDAGLISLSGSAFTAADVDKSGQVTAFDASLILAKSVELISLPFPGAGVVWGFDPRSRAYPTLTANQTGQDFTAILLGDVSGNWASGAGPAGGMGGGSHRPQGLQPDVTLALRTLTTRSNGTQVWLLARTDRATIYSADLVFTNGSGRSLAGLYAGALAVNMATSSNTNDARQVRVAMAAAVPVQGVGALLVLTLSNGETNGLRLASASINEGAVPVTLDSLGTAFDQDSDGDGQSDWAEIRAGTRPTDEASRFALRSATLEKGRVLVSWQAVPGKTYQVLFQDTGAQGEWQALGSPLTATADQATVTDVAPASLARWYRVQLVE